MVRLFAIATVLVTGWPGPATPAAGQHPSGQPHLDIEAADWPLERVELLDGRRYEGYIESEDDAWVHMKLIQRPNGRPMFVVIRPIERKTIAAVVRLEPEQRAELRARIDQFLHRSQIERGRIEAIRLGRLTRQGVAYHDYRGKWFTLESNAEESITRRIIVQMEQIFTAYRQILPPHAEARRPLRLVVLGSMDEYHDYLARLGVKIANPACFIQDDNLVVAGSELTRFAAQLARITARHEQLRAELDELEGQLAARLAEIAHQLQEKGTPRKEIARLMRKERAKFDRQIEQKRKELDCCDRENARAFADVTRQMFARLYHEAFHAYLENYVFPREGYHVPRWLNEGLASMFEEGLLESNTLRIDAPNPAALKQLQADLRGGQPLPLAQLLTAGPQAFLAGREAGRYYAYAWGLVYYLTFEKRLLGTPALGQYVQPPEETSPVERFEKLVGAPLAVFDRAWREHVLNLP